MCSSLILYVGWVVVGLGWGWGWVGLGLRCWGWVGLGLGWDWVALIKYTMFGQNVRDLLDHAPDPF